MLKRLKFVVQGVAVELDDEGNIITERTTDPQAFYDREQLVQFADKFDSDIRLMNQSETNGTGLEEIAVEAGE